MEFQGSYFKSWKMMLSKCCTQYASKFGKLSSGHRAGKGQFLFQSQRKAMTKNAQTTAQLHSSHTLVNNAQNSPSQVSTICELWIPDVQAGFRKGRGTRDQIANIHCFLFLLFWNVLVAQLCQTLCNPMDCSMPVSSVSGISQARILQWVASSFSKTMNCG